MSAGTSGTSVVRLDLRLNDKGDWVKVFDPRDCTLFVPISPPPPVGAPCRVDLAIADSGPRVIVRGHVISRREQLEPGKPPGCTVALGAEEREKINYLNGFVRGGLLNLRERRRLPLRLPVTFGGLSGPVDSYSRDINEQGIFVVTERPLPEDSEIHLLIQFPAQDEPISVRGVVSHTVVVEDEDVPGMGIVFRFEGSQEGDFTTLIDELEQKFLNGSLPDPYLL